MPNNKKNINEDTQKKYLNMLQICGEEGVYRKTVGFGLINSTQSINPELEILDLSDAFFILYRRSGQIEFYSIGRALRRAAHVIYRELRRQNKNKKPNFERFLNAI